MENKKTPTCPMCGCEDLKVFGDLYVCNICFYDFVNWDSLHKEPITEVTREDSYEYIYMEELNNA